jgi:hypothetical protein
LLYGDAYRDIRINKKFIDGDRRIACSFRDKLDDSVRMARFACVMRQGNNTALP